GPPSKAGSDPGCAGCVTTQRRDAALRTACTRGALASQQCRAFSERRFPTATSTSTPAESRRRPCSPMTRTGAPSSRCSSSSGGGTAGRFTPLSDDDALSLRPREHVPPALRRHATAERGLRAWLQQAPCSPWASLRWALRLARDRGRGLPARRL